MMILSDYARILQVTKFCGGGGGNNNYLPSMIFLYTKYLFKIVLGQNFFNSQPIFKIIAAHFRTNKALNFEQTKIFCLQLN